MKCEVLRKSFINNREVYPGDIIEYAGKNPGSNLRPITEKAKPIKQMDHAELLEFAAAHKIELKDPDNMTDAEIQEAIIEAQEKATI